MKLISGMLALLILLGVCGITGLNALNSYKWKNEQETRLYWNRTALTALETGRIPENTDARYPLTR